MADNRKSKTEHAFKRIQNDIKSDTLGSVILLCGAEDYLVRWSFELIKKVYVNAAFSEMDCVTVSEENTTAEHIIENCDTVSMMSERKLVAVDGCYAFSEGNIPSGSEDSDILCEYLNSVPEETILLFRGEPEGKKNAIYSAVKAAGKVYSFDPLDRKTLRMFILKRIRLCKRDASPSVCDSIISACGYFNRDIEYSLDQLVNDIDKVTAVCDNDTVTEKDVSEIFNGGIENNVFLFIDAVSRNNKAECFRRLEELLVSDNNTFQIIALVVSQMEIIYQIKEMTEEGKAPKEISKILRIHEFRFKKASQISRKLSMKNCRKMLLNAYEIDKSVKTGLMNERLAMEYFIACI